MSIDFKQYIRAGKTASDITPLLADGPVFKELIRQLAALHAHRPVTRVACIEGKGFILGAAVAYELGVGVVPIRYPGKLQQGVYTREFIDYSGSSKTLTLHQDAVNANDRILLIDDWVETGATIKAAIELIEQGGGRVIAVGSLMDSSNAELKAWLQPYNYKYLLQVTEADMF